MTNYVIAGEEFRLESRSRKKQKEQRISPLLPPFAPPPRHQANLKLVQRSQSLASTVVRRLCTAGIEAYNRVLNRTETALPSRPDGDWICRRRVQRVVSTRGGGCKVKTAFTFAAAIGSQHVIDETSLGVIWGRACSGASAESSQSRIPGGRISRDVAHFGCVDCTNRAGCSRLIGSHARPQQVRNSNRSDDQDDRHDDQQLN